MSEKVYEIEGKKYRLLKDSEKFSPATCLCLIEVGPPVEFGDVVVFSQGSATSWGVVYGFWGNYLQVADVDGDRYDLSPKNIQSVRRRRKIIWERP